MALLRFFHQDRHACFQVWRLHRYRQAPAEARFQALLNTFYFLGVTVASEDHLLTALEQRVECVKELFLGAIFVGEELNVID